MQHFGSSLLSHLQAGGVEDILHPSFDLFSNGLGQPVQDIAHLVGQAALAQALAPDFPDGPNQAGGAVSGDHDRGAQPTPNYIPDERQAGLVALAAAQGEMEQHLPPVPADSPGTQDALVTAPRS